ncbi:trypsin-1-like [Phlebotomus argentipes]|uniref:trypsin-1-like n=1 Tax=Phlebotomus argentipes TaxID=94469 RepID=UPI002893055F|nr:trypsin-1-like [Phlebotomus argentipes]
MKVFVAVLALVSAVLAAPADVSTPKLAFVNERITNGQDAAFGEFPYICSMQWVLITASSHVCGCSVINPNWVLTAAHCYTEIPNIGRVDAVCGITDLTVTGTQQRHTINPHIIHPDYPGGVAPNDIAVGRLAGTLTFNANVQPINLPAQGQAPILGNAVLAGWGSTSTTNVPSMPNRLQRANKPVHTFQQCCDLLNSVIAGACNNLATSNVCAGGGPISACGGDSGGPLSQQVGGTWTQIGVVSWGVTPCGTTVAPSVYVMVSSFRNWIDANIN